MRPAGHRRIRGHRGTTSSAHKFEIGPSLPGNASGGALLKTSCLACRNLAEGGIDDVGVTL